MIPKMGLGCVFFLLSPSLGSQIDEEDDLPSLFPTILTVVF